MVLRPLHIVAGETGPAEPTRPGGEAATKPGPRAAAQAGAKPRPAQPAGTAGAKAKQAPAGVMSVLAPKASPKPGPAAKAANPSAAAAAPRRAPAAAAARAQPAAPSPARPVTPPQAPAPASTAAPAQAPRAVDPAHYQIAEPVGNARMRPRHFGVLALFLALVVLPTLSYSWYLWARAADQYESLLGFGSRTEEGPNTFGFLGVLTGGGQSGSRDMDILYEFVVSQELVAKIDRELDLKAIWSKPQSDPLNAFNPAGTIEDLVDYWERMVRVDYDTSTGLMNLAVHAFDPQDAQRIAAAILRDSTDIVNELSKTAQQDTTRYSKQILDETQAKLADARLAVLDYQMRNNIVDPSNVVANQMTVVASLNQELANAEVELDLLAGTVPAADPRIATLKRKIEVIRNRIAVEGEKVGSTPSQDSPGFAKLMADYERLRVEQDFAQQAYLAALAAHNQAMADAQRKTRYLATYVEPTLAQASTAPNRPLQAALAALIGFLAWSITVLTYYALRDRR